MLRPKAPTAERQISVKMLGGVELSKNLEREGLFIINRYRRLMGLSRLFAIIQLFKFRLQNICKYSKFDFALLA